MLTDFWKWLMCTGNYLGLPSLSMLPSVTNDLFSFFCWMFHQFFLATSSYLQQEDSLFATMPPLCPIGSHSKVQSPKSVTGGLGAFTKVFLLAFVPGQGAQY